LEQHLESDKQRNIKNGSSNKTAKSSVHRQFRKLTKTKGGFPNENSLLKLLCAGLLDVSKKWTIPIQNWNMTLSKLAIHFEGRLVGVLDIYARLADTKF